MVWEVDFQGAASVLVWALRGTASAKEKYSLGTSSSGRCLHTIPHHTSVN